MTRRSPVRQDNPEHPRLDCFTDLRCCLSSPTTSAPDSPVTIDQYGDHTRPLWHPDDPHRPPPFGDCPHPCGRRRSTARRQLPGGPRSGSRRQLGNLPGLPVIDLDQLRWRRSTQIAAVSGDKRDRQAHRGRRDPAGAASSVRRRRVDKSPRPLAPARAEASPQWIHARRRRCLPALPVNLVSLRYR
jgi:hypothetical protein